MAALSGQGLERFERISCVCVYIYIYIYIYRERERERVIDQINEFRKIGSREYLPKGFPLRPHILINISDIEQFETIQLM